MDLFPPDLFPSPIRFALRALSRNFRFTVLAVLCLAVAIGGNVALFTLVDTAILDPLPVGDAGGLVQVFDTYRDEERFLPEVEVSFFNFFEYRRQCKGFESLEAMWSRNFTLDTEAGAQILEGVAVTAGLLPTYRVDPILGRHFLAGEDVPGGARVALLAYGTWQRLFGGAESAVGAFLDLDGERYEVVGVLPEGFRLLANVAEVFVPLQRNPQDTSLGERRLHKAQVVGRLAPGSTRAEVNGQLALVSERLAEQYGDTHRGWGANTVAIGQPLADALGTRLLALQLAGGCLILIACTNLASFLLMEAERRSGDTAVRRALGAPRWAITRQFLTESLALALTGGFAGLALAALTVGPLSTSGIFDEFASTLGEARIGPRGVLFALVLSVVVGLAFTLILSWRSFGANLGEVLKAEGRAPGGKHRRRFLDGLVVAEVALTLLLLIAAGLTLRSFRHLSQVDLGFEADRRIVVRLELPGRLYEESARRSSFVAQLANRAAGLAGVESVGISNFLPTLNLISHHGTFNLEDRPELSEERVLFARFYLIDPGYLPTLGVGILEGRYFDERDHGEAAGTVIVSRTMAKTYWGDGSPLGRRIQRGPKASAERPWLTVVGVVEDVRDAGPNDPGIPAYYLPYPQRAANDLARNVHLVVRSAAALDAGLAEQLREQVLRIDSGVPIRSLTTLEDYVAGALGGRRFSALVASVLSLLSVALAVLGIYGVLSHFVTTHDREIGIRSALGARRGDVLLWVLRRGLLLALAGGVLGLVGAVFLNRFLENQLLGVGPLDPAAILGALLLLAGVSVPVCCLPAWRASRVDPMEALRQG